MREKIQVHLMKVFFDCALQNQAQAPRMNARSLNDCWDFFFHAVYAILLIYPSMYLILGYGVDCELVR